MDYVKDILKADNIGTVINKFRRRGWRGAVCVRAGVGWGGGGFHVYMSIPLALESVMVHNITSYPVRVKDPNPSMNHDKYM